jgi:SH3-like domain-containing protein
MCVNSTRANIRKGPGSGHEIIWQAFNNTPLKILKKTNRWYSVVDYGGYTGWVHSSLVSARKCVIVKSKTAYIHLKPSPYSYVEWETDEGFPFRVLKTDGDWVKVRGYKNTFGWIYISDIWGI